MKCNIPLIKQYQGIISMSGLHVSCFQVNFQEAIKFKCVSVIHLIDVFQLQMYMLYSYTDVGPSPPTQEVK